MKRAGRTATAIYLTLSMGVLLSSPAQAVAAEAVNAAIGPLTNDIPRPLRDVWLQFHESELCQNVDAVFVFHERGMHIWGLADEEKYLDKLSELIGPLRTSFDIYVYPSRTPQEKSSNARNDPPPSVWNNNELRNYLQDPFARRFPSVGQTPQSALRMDNEKDMLFKQRMVMFAEQTIEWERKVKSYANDVPALAKAALDPAAAEDTRSRALSICLSHVEGIDKYSDKLAGNLERAFPRVPKRSEKARRQHTAPGRPPTLESVQQISSAAGNVARRAYRFIYPQMHTVPVLDLRQPSLLEAIRTLRFMIADFLKSTKR